MTSSISKYNQSPQKEQPCLWTAYLALKREAEALRKENAALRRREIGRGIVELAALRKKMQPFTHRRGHRLKQLFGSPN